jgi:hypothetical protein
MPAACGATRGRNKKCDVQQTFILPSPMQLLVYPLLFILPTPLFAPTVLRLLLVGFVNNKNQFSLLKLCRKTCRILHLVDFRYSFCEENK